MTIKNIMCRLAVGRGSLGPLGQSAKRVSEKPLLALEFLILPVVHCGPFKLLSFSFSKLKLLLIQVKAISRCAAFYGYL